MNRVEKFDKIVEDFTLIDFPPNTFRYFEGTGWYDILYEGFKYIEDVMTKHDLKECKVLQIKEKFGTMCVYATHDDYNDLIYNKLMEMERQSEFACELCGSDKTIIGSRDNFSHMVNWCKKCRIKDKLKQ